MTILALTFIWVIRSIAPKPQPQPATGNTPFPNVETAPQSSAPQKLIDYKVKEGDTCAFIAGKYDTTVEEIMKRNNLTGACRIMIDQVLKIPVKADSANLPQGEAYDTSMGQFIMTVDLPDAVPQATLYQLDPAQENADYQVKTIRDLAARIGINGSLYQMQERYGGPGYIFTDGKQRIEVTGYCPPSVFLLYRLHHISADRESRQCFITRRDDHQSRGVPEGARTARLPLPGQPLQ